jgi:Fe2+ transport system protein FeoA
VNLLSAFPGKRYLVLKIKDPLARRQADCLGMGEGEEVYCVARKANGPVILGRGGQMVAVGGKIARGIQISPRRGPKR